MKIINKKLYFLCIIIVVVAIFMRNGITARAMILEKWSQKGIREYYDNPNDDINNIAKYKSAFSVEDMKRAFENSFMLHLLPGKKIDVKGVIKEKIATIIYNYVKEEYFPKKVMEWMYFAEVVGMEKVIGFSVSYKLNGFRFDVGGYILDSKIIKLEVYIDNDNEFPDVKNIFKNPEKIFIRRKDLRLEENGKDIIKKALTVTLINTQKYINLYNTYWKESQEKEKKVNEERAKERYKRWKDFVDSYDRKKNGE